MHADPPNRTLSQLIWVSAGRTVLLGTWFAATILIGRVLGVVGFGVYVYCQTAIKIVTSCVGDPLDMAVMRQGPILLRRERSAALELVRSAFWLRVIVGVVVFAIVAIAPGLAAREMFNDPQLAKLAMLTAAGVLGDFLLRSALGFFQISEAFQKFLIADAAWQGGRVVIVLGLVMLHKLTPMSAVAVYVLMPYVAFAVAVILMPGDVRRLAPAHRGHVTEILHYSKWIVAGMAMAAAYERLDILLLQHFKGEHELGLYAAALTWALIPDFLNGILQTVLAPKIAPGHAAGRFNLMQRTYLMVAVPIGLAFLAFALPAAGWVMRIFMSDQYAAATNIYRILIVSTVFNVVATPLPEALMNFVAPKRVTIYSAIGLVWVAVGGVVLIPRFGGIGAAWVMLVARVVVGGMVMVQAYGVGKTVVLIDNE